MSRHVPYVICIPSYKRHDICVNKTLRTLRDNGISPLHIHVYVANCNEYKLYREAIVDTNIAIHIGMKGLVQQRAFIEKQYSPGTHIVFMDDDIESIDLSLSQQFQNKTLHEFILYAFKETKQQGAYIWGVYPVFNEFYREPQKDVTNTLKYIVGAFYGVINRPFLKDLRLVLTKKDGQKEDVERSIKYFLYDGKVIRFNKIGFVTKYYGKTGGLGTFQDRLQPMKEAALRLEAKYPDMGRVITKKSGMTEFRFVKKYTIKSK